MRRIKGEQIDWTIAALRSITDVDDCRLHLIAHHSLWQDEGGDKHTPLDRRRRLEDELLSQFSFSSFVHGHNHRYLRRISCILFLVANLIPFFF